jgi:iron complex outermembrane receptor protein
VRSAGFPGLGVIGLLLTLTLLAPAAMAHAAERGQIAQQPEQSLKKLSLADLGNIQVTTASKEPDEVWRVPAAIHVITHEDIRRSGATSLPEALRLAPGLAVARIDSGHWSVGCEASAINFRSQCSC